MNISNKLTIMRILIVPLFIYLLFANNITLNYLLSLLVFIIACITDIFDGYIARQSNSVTTFGKFLDPLADKILVMSAYIGLIEIGIISYLPVIIIMAREFLVTSLRLVASDKNVVISANNLGKIKTVIQMLSIIVILFLLFINKVGSMFDYPTIRMFSDILMWLSALISIISCIYYVYSNKNLIFDEK